MNKKIFVKPGDKFIVTGKRRNSKRNFKAIVCNSYFEATCYNVWRGNIWLLRDGKRTLLTSIWN